MSLSDKVVDEIGKALEELRRTEQALRKATTVLVKARAAIGKSAWPFREIHKLLDQTAELKAGPRGDAFELLERSLRELTTAAETTLEKDFLTSLPVEAQRAELPFGLLASAYYLGPFELRVQARKHRVEIWYGKLAVGDPLALDAKLLMQRTKALARRLLELGSDAATLHAEFEEAHLVALARAKQRLVARETRVPILDLYAEMKYIRETRGGKPAADGADYSIPRFVVELKALVQSDFNLSAAARFRLETAVIENTKNNKKSLFVPADPRVGYGEGTYFQAMVLVNTAG